MKLSELKKLLKASWSKETSADPKNWTLKNPSWGQCAVTALVVQDFLGGELVRTVVEKFGSHYWNKLPNGKEKDFTRQQFPEGTIILENKIRTVNKNHLFLIQNVRKRFALLRLAVENQISPNPLFSNRLYQMCFESAQTSECQKMKFGCLVVYKGKVVARTSNKTIEALRHLCKPECIRFKIQSRTESMIGACGHAEEWALWETTKLGIPLKDCSFYIAGFDGKTNQPWIKKANEHTCLRCAVQMHMAGVGKIYVPFIDRWGLVTSEEAVKASVAYALKEKKI